MCDIGLSRKILAVLVLVLFQFHYSSTQLDIPGQQYSSTSQRPYDPSSTVRPNVQYPYSSTARPDPNYPLDRNNGPYNIDISQNFDRNNRFDGQDRTRYDGQDRTRFDGQDRTRFEDQDGTRFDGEDRSRFGPENYPSTPGPNQRPGYSGNDIRALLEALDVQSSQQCTNNVAAQWNFETNVNQGTQLEALNAQQIYSDFQRGVRELLNKLGNVNIPNAGFLRELRYLSIVGPAALSPDQLDRYNRLINDMLAIYNSASICVYNEPFHCGLRLQPDLVNIMALSRNWDELQHVWTEWRRNTGMPVKETYEQLVTLSNEAARLNNFTDTAEYWNFPFESSTFNIDLEDALLEVKPLYELLHAYVRRRLRDYYGPDKLSRQAPLPAHILGNMWAQSWVNIFDITQPYPGQHFLDVTPEMLRQGYAPIDLFRLAEDFFVSMNMSAMPLEFWSGSVLEQPPDRVVLCQPSAWDFCNRKDFRIKMCTNVNMKDLITAHHEMAHIHYFMAYQKLPKVFRDGANPAFHEAIGEAIGLSVGTPRHLQTLGLVPNSVDDSSVDINFLYLMALDKVVFLPFSYVVDKWRYDVFKGNILKDQYNCHWWRLTEQYMGIKPPVLRSERDFDPGSKYHVPANIPYLRYFVSTILQFQIYRSLCRAAGQYVVGDYTKPLHKCDIYRSKEAGRILQQLMEKGSALPWKEALYQATGETRLDGSAMREYFRPLEEWLRNENLRTQEFIGWLYDGDYCKQSIETAGLQVYGGFYNGACLSQPTLTVIILAISITFLWRKIV